mmetsp:Transcript_39134/g.63442  ORF Transcript_39134/g.63442 Transcript_39134/m.63442 type:complete len:802 (-) Transcript_39134:157-2562(-)|eukprot:CAMPEP_0184331778 /NCGR_PEP_ID=MMETSP1089-20130417/1057_1 /TAXON_ID=38269 ORGANISM="Gloeochaete wittrockiana, Strain SAG46.84" /NCGR_SAMPLE_ID=MMETSP1089 /ASSEMBLY_ACC=CAM_ASM_000445 /LENGTH=801 /DNA_ID=CAMNT_0026654867 /DNA_START=255 /DNA_END=2660 /DNA_ORIENTATION=+
MGSRPRWLALILFVLSVAVVLVAAKPKPNELTKVDSLLNSLIDHHKAHGIREARFHERFSTLRWSSTVEKAKYQRDEEILVLVEIHLSKDADSDALKSAVVSFGGTIVTWVDWYRYGILTCYVPVEALLELSKLSGIQIIKGVQKPVVNRMHKDVLEKTRSLVNSTLASSVVTNAITGTALNDQAFVPMRVDQARARCPALSRAGAGISIAILSDSFNYLGGYATDVAGGYLPGRGNPLGYTTPVYIAHELSGSVGTDEGRGMAQLVHAFAPYAKLCFATAYNGEATTAAYLRELAGPPCNADIIVDDITYFNEGYFQDTIWSVTVDQLAAAPTGIQYFTSAGNFRDNNAFVEKTFVGERVSSIDPNYIYHKFNIPGAPSPYLLPITATEGFGLFFQWSEAEGKVALDFDFFLVSLVSSSFTVLARGDSNSISNGFPMESLQVNSAFGVYYVVVGVYLPGTGPYTGGPQKFVVFSASSSASFGSAATQRCILGHAGATWANSIAAYNYAPLALQTYSSVGPVTMSFDGSGNSYGPNGQVRNKPDFAAIDCTDTSFFGSFNPATNLYAFCGTSAAAPHAAAVGALVIQAAGGRGSVSPVQLRRIFFTSSERATWSFDRGYGLLNALSAVLKTCTSAGPSTPTRRPQTPTRSRVTPSRSRKPNTPTKRVPTRTPANVCSQPKTAINVGRITNANICSLPLNSRRTTCTGLKTVGKAVNYEITAPSAPGTYVYTVNTGGSNYDTVLEAFLQSAACPVLACNDDYGDSTLSGLRFSLGANQKAVIRVSGFVGACGNLVLSVARSP